MAGRWIHFDDIYKSLDKKTHQSIIDGGNEVLDAAVQSAKANHPGWKTVTGEAEGSIKKIPMTRTSSGHYRGYLISDLARFVWLEIGTRFFPGDHTLRRAVDREFPTVARRIRNRL